MNAAFEIFIAPLAAHAPTQPIESAERNDALLRLARSLQADGYRFTTVTPATHARVNSQPGREWAADTSCVFGWSRPFMAGLLSPELLALMHDAKALVRHGEGWRSLIRLSTLHDRLFVHSAYPTTDTDAVFFGPDTYRFCSAIAAHLADENVRVKRAVDIGCGAGPGAIVVALARPDAQVLAVDINDKALRLTAVNAELAGARNVVPCYSNLLSGTKGDFDLIVANPPYLLDAGERAYRHGGGGHGEGMSLAIVDAAIDRLAPGGTVRLNTGSTIVDGEDRFRSMVASRLDAAGLEWHYREMDPDVFGEELLESAYADADRIAAVVLTVRAAA